MKKERNIGLEILDGLKEIKEWQQGKKKLKITRAQFPRAADVAKIRRNLELTQDEFADFMGVNLKTLQNWEQRRREPQGPARSLLRIAEKAPEAILKALPRNMRRFSSHSVGVQKKKSSSR